MFHNLPDNYSMFKRLHRWYKTLTPLKRLAITFVIFWSLWFILGLVGDKWFLEIDRSIVYHLIHAIWMALIFCIFYEWKTIRAPFKKNAGKNSYP